MISPVLRNYVQSYVIAIQRGTSRVWKGLSMFVRYDRIVSRIAGEIGGMRASPT